MAQFVALLRGINVGGNNLIKMAELKKCFEAEGFGNVATYIQSGNVLFEAKERSHASLTSRVEEALARAFGYKSWVALRSRKQLQAIVEGAPRGFGVEPASYLCDVIFLRAQVAAAEAITDVKTREGVDQAFAGDGVLYFSRLRSKATQSYLSRIIALPVYKSMTIRNWNTTTRLLGLMDARDGIGRAGT
jgi:uncharacterized protein (DUF1697 family)